MLKVAVLVSGGGTNLQAILDAIDNGMITNAKSGSCDQQQQKCIRFRTCEKSWDRGSLHFSEGLRDKRCVQQSISGKIR